jgi:hypothetical protein
MATIPTVKMFAWCMEDSKRAEVVQGLENLLGLLRHEAPVPAPASLVTSGEDNEAMAAFQADEAVRKVWGRLDWLMSRLTAARPTYTGLGAIAVVLAIHLLRSGDSGEWHVRQTARLLHVPAGALSRAAAALMRSGIVGFGGGRYWFIPAPAAGGIVQ